MELNKVSDLKSAVKEGQVRLKILKHVQAFVPGDVIDADKASADALLLVGHTNDGVNMILQRRAMLLKEAEELETQEVDLRKLTQCELEAMGKKNIVQTPKDPVFEARLAGLMKPAEVKVVDEAKDEDGPSADVEKDADQEPKKKKKY